jgi:TPR repeat protein
LSGTGATGERAKLALKLIKLAAESGHPEANAVLGHIYETGGFEDKGRFHPILKRN